MKTGVDGGGIGALGFGASLGLSALGDSCFYAGFYDDFSAGLGDYAFFYAGFDAEPAGFGASTSISKKGFPTPNVFPAST